MTIQTRSQVLRLTEAAAERIRALQAASGGQIEGVRIGVKNGGCAGMEYTMEYAGARGPHDEVVEDKGVKLLIDPTAVMFLLGTEMDYRADRMRSGFVFNNPNQTSACGCGESVTLKPADEAARDRSEAPDKAS
ncbi:MAG: iron-sulfur cluster assembly accessory protein [Methyloceanibacter sp.]|nr:iron-sulfur cluster assembly accessory protein [Methyloceanibacter sp.]